MLRRKVTGPDGRTWTLGRRWMPGRTSLGRAKLSDISGWAPGLDGGVDDLGVVGVIIAALIAVVVLVILALVLLNVVAIAIELLIVVVLLVAGVVGRVAFRRPWTVFAKSGSEIHSAAVVGWRASRRAIDDMAGRIASGAQLEPAPGHRR